MKQAVLGSLNIFTVAYDKFLNKHMNTDNNNANSTHVSSITHHTNSEANAITDKKYIFNPHT